MSNLTDAPVSRERLDDQIETAFKDLVNAWAAIDLKKLFEPRPPSSARD